MKQIENLESEVRGYCRSFPATFTTAEGSWLRDDQGRRYLDFFCGAGVMNYGHHPARLKERLLEYLEGNGLVHGLDLCTEAKEAFLERLHDVVLEPRGLDYKVQFPGPTGTNAVEAALKLARNVTQRQRVVAFTNAFHGMTLGSLAATANAYHRGAAGTQLTGIDRLPFDGYLGEGVDTLDLFQRMLEDGSSGIDKPAAVILETVQAEGGINVASSAWLQRLERLCREHRILLIVDDIQVGCGRTGPFFSFEPTGIRPDLVCLSKSLSGYGLPLAVVLIAPDIDAWRPGEHNGTFRGHNPAFVTATAALDYWTDARLETETGHKAESVDAGLSELLDRHAFAGETRGRGLIQGIAYDDVTIAAKVSAAAFERGLVVETAGADDEVLKLLPPLTISDADLTRGLEILDDAIGAVTLDTLPARGAG